MAPTHPGPLAIAALLVGRDVRARLASFWFAVVASLTCLIAWLYGAGFQQTFLTESVLVTTDPLLTLHIIIIVFLSVILALRLAASMAWEREHRTLEVLLVGPAGWIEIITAKFAAEVIVLAALVLIYLAYLLLAQPLGAGVITPPDTLGVLAMAAFALPTLALGLLVGALARTVRTGVVSFAALFAILAGFEAALGFLQQQAPDQATATELQVRAALETVAPGVAALTAAGQMAALVKVLTEGAVLSAQAVAWTLGLALATLGGATLLARLRGAE